MGLQKGAAALGEPFDSNSQFSFIALEPDRLAAALLIDFRHSFCAVRPRQGFVWSAIQRTKLLVNTLLLGVISSGFIMT